MEALQILVDILNKNPVVFLTFFAISLVANFIQIFSYLQERQRLREEIGEREKLVKLVETYEYILNLAQRNIKTESEMQLVEEAITEKTNLIEAWLRNPGS